jgi:hypothetical protein
LQTLKLAPKRAPSIKLREEPTRTKLRTLQADPHCKKLRILALCDNLAKLLKLKEDPISTDCITDNSNTEPHLNNPITEQLLPKRKAVRIETLLPKWAKSKTDKEEANLAKLRRLKPEPQCTKLSKLMALPARIDERRDNALPKVVKSKIDSLSLNRA